MAYKNNMSKNFENKYDGILNIYGHKELIETLKKMCDIMLDKRLLKLFDDKIIFNIVENDETREIMNMKVTFFDIYSLKEKQFGFNAEFDDISLTCLGDEPLNEKCLKYVQNSDWLLSEAFCMYEDRKKFDPYEKHHSTVKDAAEVAQKLNVKKLVLYHTEDTDLKNRKINYSKEAENYFSGKIYVPDDLEEIILN